MTLAKTLKNLTKAHDAAVRAMKRHYPVGQRLIYGTGIHGRVAAEVTDHGYGLRLKVRGVLSGKEYWLDAHRILS